MSRSQSKAEYGRFAHLVVGGIEWLLSQWQELTGGEETDLHSHAASGGGSGSPFYVSEPILAEGVSSGAPIECDLFAGLLAQSGVFAASGAADLALPQAGVYEVLVTAILANPDGTACPYTIGSTAAADLNYDDDIVVTVPPSAASLSITAMTTVTATAGQTVGLSIAQGAGGHTSQDVTLRLLVRYLGPASG